MTRCLVVGAGPTGLGCAAELALAHHVDLIDRIPVPGGEAGWESASIAGLVRRARRAGVRFRLGRSALRWEPGRLLIAGPDKIEWVPGSWLFYAGGLRPGMTADLGITGDRPAGVLPATVARHLLAADSGLWRRVAIIGDGPWAPAVAAQARGGGAQVIAILPSPGRPDWADEAVTAAGQIAICGGDRVRAVRVGNGPRSADVSCDAVVLAGSPRPNRNVTGALSDDSPGVVFVQPISAAGIAERSALGRQAARDWLAANGGRD